MVKSPEVLSKNLVVRAGNKGATGVYFIVGGYKAQGRAKLKRVHWRRLATRLLSTIPD